MAIFEPKKRIEEQYKRNLKGLFNNLYDYIINGNIEAVVNSKSFSSFANSIASRMITGIAVEGAKDWREAARKGMEGRRIYEALQQELKGPVGYKVQSLIDQNAQLIKTFPLELSKSVTNYIKEESLKGLRASEIAESLKTQYPTIAESRINLIARTETSKASTALTESRANNLGLNWYIWRTSEDIRVRSSHEIMEDVLINWAFPPSPERLKGIKSSLGNYHAGNCPNCRCYPEPVININMLKFPVKVYVNGSIIRMSKAEFFKLGA